MNREAVCRGASLKRDPSPAPLSIKRVATNRSKPKNKVVVTEDRGTKIVSHGDLKCLRNVDLQAQAKIRDIVFRTGKRYIKKETLLGLIHAYDVERGQGSDKSNAVDVDAVERLLAYDVI